MAPLQEIPPMLVTHIPIIRLAVVAAMAIVIAACATAPAQNVDLTPPPKKQLDAKTQLETGRSY
jgi:hypothetical protein